MGKKVNIHFVSLIVLFSLLVSTPGQAQKLTWHSFDNALAIADTTGRPILVDVWAPWCGWCLRMKQEVYPALEKQLSGRFVLTRLNRDDHETTYRYRDRELTSFRLAQALKAQSVPTMVLLTPDGEYLLHLTGFREVETLKPVLEYVDRDRNQSMKIFRR